MPQLVHGLVGLSVGAATAQDVRTPWLRSAWIGTTFLLAYLPDVIEWGLRLCGVRLPHSAAASLPCTVAGCAVLYAALRFGVRETGRISTAVALGVFASHMVLDAWSGGIPLWWPFSETTVGTDWLSFDRWRGHRERLLREALACTPLVVIGLVVGLVRSRGACWDRRMLWNVVPALPVLALGGLQWYVWEHMRAGTAHHQAGRYAAAIDEYAAAARFPVVGFEGTPRARIAQCLVGLGQYDAAFQILERGRRDHPANMEYVVGFAELHLQATDERYFRPDVALEQIDILMAYGGSAQELAYYQRLREQALRRIADSRPVPGGTSTAWPPSD